MSWLQIFIVRKKKLTKRYSVTNCETGLHGRTAVNLSFAFNCDLIWRRRKSWRGRRTNRAVWGSLVPCESKAVVNSDYLEKFNRVRAGLVGVGHRLLLSFFADLTRWLPRVEIFTSLKSRHETIFELETIEFNITDFWILVKIYEFSPDFCFHRYLILRIVYQSSLVKFLYMTNMAFNVLTLCVRCKEIFTKGINYFSTLSENKNLVFIA